MPRRKNSLELVRAQCNPLPVFNKTASGGRGLRVWDAKTGRRLCGKVQDYCLQGMDFQVKAVGLCDELVAKNVVEMTMGID